MKNIIFLVDMNSFYVTCELLRYPQYKKKALIISGKGKRSVVTAASYVAKNQGIDSAMSLQNALKINPQITILEPDFTYYRQKSKEIMNFLQKFTQHIHTASVDEAYIDVTHYFTEETLNKENILKLAKFIQVRLLKELGFPCNIGISTNRFLAKMASELDKPFKVDSIFVSEVEEKLWPLPVRKMHGIGKKTAKVLEYLNIQTIGMFATFENERLLEKLLGKNILEQQQYARGIVDKEKEEVRERERKKSISQSRTFIEDEQEQTIILEKLAELWGNVVQELEKQHLKFKGIKVFYKRSDFQTIQRSITFEDYRSDYERVYQTALKLFNSLWEGEAVRLIGIGVFSFIAKDQHAEQMNIFQIDWEDVPEKVKAEKKASVLELLNQQYKITTAQDLLKNSKIDKEKYEKRENDECND